MAKYRFVNVNPSGAMIDDCVARALSNATGLPYNVIVDKLYLTSELLDCDRLCIGCYSFLIDDVFGFTPIECRGMTADEFADRHPHGTYLARSSGHITLIRNGTIEDTWDSRDILLTNAWKIE